MYAIPSLGGRSQPSTRGLGARICCWRPPCTRLLHVIEHKYMIDSVSEGVGILIPLGTQSTVMLMMPAVG